MRRDAPEWFGLVVSVTELFILADRFWNSPPDVNDLARLVSRAAERPCIGKPHRPRVIRIRPLPEWSELIPHLEQLNIEVVRQDELQKFDEEVSGFRLSEEREIANVFSPRRHESEEVGRACCLADSDQTGYSGWTSGWVGSFNT